MPRPQKPQYEYIASRGYYRKRIKATDGKYVAIYGRTPEELTEKLETAKQEIEEVTFRRNNPTVKEYAEKWLEMHSANIRQTTLADYTSCVKNHIIEPLGERFMIDITPDDVKTAITKAASLSQSVYRKTQMLYKMIFLSAVESHIILP